MVMENEKTLFQPGDLVEITDGTHTDALPDNRTGLIIERVANSVYNIKFTNGNILKFHRMFIRLINGSKDVNKSQ
jgi:hypothetical protein